MIAAEILHFLDAARGEGRLGGDGLRQFADCCGQRLVGGKNAVDQAEPFAFVGKEIAAGEGEFAGCAFADQA